MTVMRAPAGLTGWSLWLKVNHLKTQVGALQRETFFFFFFFNIVSPVKQMTYQSTT